LRHCFAQPLFDEPDYDLAFRIAAQSLLEQPNQMWPEPRRDRHA
jgi:hypothetical protein